MKFYEFAIGQRVRILTAEGSNVGTVSNLGATNVLLNLDGSGPAEFRSIPFVLILDAEELA